MPVPVFRPFIKRRDMDAVLTSLVSDAANTGVETEAFVAEALEVVACEAGAAFRELSRGVRVAIDALELAPGSRIALPVLAPALYARAIREAGHEPVLLDCLEANPCLDAAEAARLHAESPLAAIFVCFSLGFRPDMAALRGLGLPLLVDLSESVSPALAAGGVDCGDIALFGLEANHLLTAGGGVLVAAKGRKEALALGRACADLPAGAYLQDLNAALGRSQLRQLDYFMQKRDEMRELFRRSALRGRHQLPIPVGEGAAVPYGFPLLVQSSVPEVQAYARKKNVETCLAFAASVIHDNQASPDFEPRRFPRSYGFLMRCLLFPLYPGMTGKELEMIDKVIASLP